MPRAGWVKPTDDQRLSDHVALGVLTSTFPPELVDQVVRASGRGEQWHRLLPARLVVYYVLAPALFAAADYVEVMRHLVEGLSRESGWRQQWTVPSQPAISQARPDTLGAFYRDWRLTAIDGTTLDVADSVENAAEFGRPGSVRGERSAFPQLRLVALAEAGTRAVTGVALGPYRTGEPTLARAFLPGIGPGTLVLADRGFTAQPLFTAAAETGADLCWRAQSNAVLPVRERFADGSYRSEIVASDDKRTRARVTSVRVIEYTVDDPGRPGAEDHRDRLLTTIADPTAAPAPELAALYPEHWRAETTLDEMKTHQRGPRLLLRSRTPEGVRQEVYGYLCTHYAIRSLMATAASDRGGDPDPTSFTRALPAARRGVRAGLGAAHQALAAALPATRADIGGGLLPRRRLRAAPRVVARPMSTYGVKRPEPRAWPQPTRRPADAVRTVSRQYLMGGGLTWCLHPRSSPSATRDNSEFTPSRRGVVAGAGGFEPPIT